MPPRKDKSDMNKYVDSLIGEIAEQYAIDPRYYKSDAVKRGLRNADGSGVIAGVTRIGSVQGYYMSDSEKMPIPGALYYRGVSIDDLIANHGTAGPFGYEEVAYLLLFGKLPGKDRFSRFNRALVSARRLPAGFFEDMILKAPSRNVMNKLARSILAMYSYDADPDSTDTANIMRQSMKLIGCLPTIVAHAYAVKRHCFDGKSLYIHNPDGKLSVAENFLRMLRKDKSFSDDEAMTLDLMMMVHAEHGGGNNSTFACRTLSSSGTDTYSAIAAAVGSLKGPLHGGANMKVREMADYISARAGRRPTDAKIRDALAAILAKRGGDRSGKIYGLGHAIYTISDPRAEAIKRHAAKIVQEKGFSREFEILEAVERIGIPMVMEKTGRELPMCANVDLYSGLVYKALGIPADLCTPLFAISRVAGWCAHRLEEVLCGGRIIRPAYRSSIKRVPYVPMAERRD